MILLYGNIRLNHQQMGCNHQQLGFNQWKMDMGVSESEGYPPEWHAWLKNDDEPWFRIWHPWSSHQHCLNWRLVGLATLFLEHFWINHAALSTYADPPAKDGEFLSPPTKERTQRLADPLLPRMFWLGQDETSCCQHIGLLHDVSAEINQHRESSLGMRPGLKAIRPIQETTTGSIDLFVGGHLQETSGNQVLFTIKSRVSTVFFPINQFSSNPDPHLLLSSSARFLFLPCRIWSFIVRHCNESCSSMFAIMKIYMKITSESFMIAVVFGRRMAISVL